MRKTHETTQLLLDWHDGDEVAAELLLPLIYDQLHHLAARFMAAERQGHTLQPTALAHEAWLRLVDQSRVEWQNRAHFFSVAAEMIRRILVDHARQRASLKRGGAFGRVALDAIDEPGVVPEVDLLALDEALDQLDLRSPRQRRIVEMRYFGGLNVVECATALDVSPATVKADWRVARAWLRDRLEAPS